MDIQTFDLCAEIGRIKENIAGEGLGMILVHNGVVRATSREGKELAVSGMVLDYDERKLNQVVEEVRLRPGVVYVSVWINKGKLDVGDDIMYVVVAGDRRSNVFPSFEWLVEVLKKEVVKEVELHRF